MPSFGVYPAVNVLTAGDEISSTYEGRHITVLESQLKHPVHADGCVDKGDPVVIGARGVGVALNDGVATDLIAVDTEGLWALTVGAWNDAGISAVAGGDEIFIDFTQTSAACVSGVGDCCLSKRRNVLTQIPFGIAYGIVPAGTAGVITVKVHHDPVDLDGNGALLLAGGAKQGIMETDTIKNYELGARIQFPAPDNRVFHYCYATNDLGLDAAHAPIVATGAPNAQIGAFYNSNLHYHSSGARQVPVAAGAMDFDWYYDEAPTRRGNPVAPAADIFKGAMLIGYTQRVSNLIVGNDAFVEDAGDLGHIHIYLRDPVWQGFAAVGSTYIFPSTYSQCVWPDPGISHDGLVYSNFNGYASVVAVPLIDVPVGSYFWGQTWGQLGMINGSWGINIGDTPNERMVHFDWLGKIVHRGGGVALDSHMQPAGYVMSGQNIFLQLDP